MPVKCSQQVQYVLPVIPYLFQYRVLINKDVRGTQGETCMIVTKICLYKFAYIILFHQNEG